MPDSINRPNPNAPRVRIDRVRAGQPISARHTNRVVDAANTILNVVGPARQVRAERRADPAGIEATTRIFFCS